MIKVVVLILAVICISRCLAIGVDLDEYWTNFKKYYRKNYDAGVEAEKRQIFEKNIVRIVNHNLDADLKDFAYTLGINEYTDIDNQDFVKKYTGYKSASSSGGSAWSEPSGVSFPESLDWRTEGLVSPVKKQGACASSWAFSATGAIEGQIKKKTGKLLLTSEQNLIDCSTRQGNEGCAGGNMGKAFEYVKSNDGIDSQDFYSYTGMAGEPCKYKRGATVGTCTGYVNIPSGDEEALKKAVSAVGPISAAIDASNLSFQLYKGGIYVENKCTDSKLNHAVLVVGYGTENGVDYWLIKNSWGKSWGISGYAKVARNRKNHCGIASQASYPLV